jgi:hypothetical protein
MARYIDKSPAKVQPDAPRESMVYVSRGVVDISWADQSLRGVRVMRVLAALSIASRE